MITVQMRRFTCRACGVTFVSELLSGVNIKVAALHMRSIYCPKCGASYRKIDLRLDDLPEPPVTVEEEKEDEAAKG